MSSSQLLGILLLALGVQQLHAAFNLAGPYEATVDGVYYCDDMGTNQITYTTKLHKVSKTEYVWSTNWTFPCDMDDTVKTRTRIDKWGTGGWGKNAYTTDGANFCTYFLKTCPETFTVFLNCLNAPVECPIRKGQYFLNELPMKITCPKFPIMPYGKYRIDSSIMKNGVTLGCFRFEFTIKEVATIDG